MHDLLIILGRCIIREKSPKEPRKWSRMWDYQDVHKTAENLEVTAVKESTMGFYETKMRTETLSKRSHLKLPKLHHVNFSESLSHLSNELGNKRKCKYHYNFVLYYWPFTAAYTQFETFGNSYSKYLIKMVDFGEALNLEFLNLSGCIKLKQIHPSIGLLRKLTLITPAWTNQF
ncbi:hypothetical protein CR513_54728, partial [Mucuna pruriens]